MARDAVDFAAAGDGVADAVYPRFSRAVRGCPSINGGGGGEARDQSVWMRGGASFICALKSARQA